ncbi:MAG: Dam family site-specific DNA-(adenine-N6)-methyltransferase [Caldilineaceae bacterium SB0662_bin_9]|uniref:Site-specific DNA-methyltransferase (adenine-specific) n=1 Tax=Caldilineaceae bacterium SB0662_bin_9 TaxID=2605258 RepID=A0A6B1DPW5_9CHLR|nr:Dam family site-specific DNA-(adenine-N6)-methyltransferase [Caldilineaceae bacterium SB0662_bin_9]
MAGPGIPRARPFVKWAGGKRSLAALIWDQAPADFRDYHEPFVGGGSVFFAMPERIGKACLSDVNRELITAYTVIRDDVENLIDALQKHARDHHADEGYYLRVRAQEPEAPLQVAARFIYLNKTCYNGLYRVNRSGKFNVPKGSYKNPRICDAEGLRQASAALAQADIRVETFNSIAPEAGDFVYCDPPYDGTFTSYLPGGFGDGEQELLRDTAAGWGQRGVHVMISNSDTPLIRDLYSGPVFRIREVLAPRFINSNGEGRGSVVEVLVTTYD